MKGTNRPFKFGPENRKEYIVEDSESSLRAINDSNGNPVFLGRAKVGTAESEDKWQIRFTEYGANQGVTSVTWPQDSDGNASNDFLFVWTSVADLTITNISQDNPGVVTVSDVGDLEDGDMLVIESVTGMTEVNFDGTNIYTAANVNSMANTFELSGIDTTGFTAYSAGGTVMYGEYLNYTYS